MLTSVNDPSFILAIFIKNVGHQGWARVKKKLAKMPWHDQSFFLISDFLVESVKANKN